jgi:hypothetical protein
MRCESKGSCAGFWLSLVLSILLILPPPAGAQQSATPAGTKPAVPAGSMQSLKVVPLAGNGESNDLERRVMAPLVVEVLDLQDRPIEGAEVVFRFPLRGPSAAFADQKSSKTVRTNGQGEAAATGWTANNEVGSFQVHVTAAYGNEIGETTITMLNATRVRDVDLNRTARRKSLWTSKWFKIGLIAGGAGLVAGIVLATRGGGTASTSTSTSTITINPGSPSVGGPP